MMKSKISFPCLSPIPEFGLCIIRLTYRSHSGRVILVLIGRAILWHLENFEENNLYADFISAGNPETSILSGPLSWGRTMFDCSCAIIRQAEAEKRIIENRYRFI